MTRTSSGSSGGSAISKIVRTVGTAMVARINAGIMVHSTSRRVLPCSCLGGTVSSPLARYLTTMKMSPPWTRTNTPTAIGNTSSQRASCFRATGPAGSNTLCAACAGSPDPGGQAPQSLFDPAGPVARKQDALWELVFPIAVGVFVLVQGGLIFMVVKYRAKGDETVPPKQLHGNTRLEVLWTMIPALILATIAVPTVRTIFEIAGPPDDPLEVRVIAKQYWFEFQYLGPEGQDVVTATELHVPTGQEVYLRMESLSAVVPDTEPEVGPKLGPVADGVIHSFWVPRLAGKVDVIPGYVRELKFQADEPGRASAPPPVRCRARPR